MPSRLNIILAAAVFIVVLAGAILISPNILLDIIAAAIGGLILLTAKAFRTDPTNPPAKR